MKHLRKLLGLTLALVMLLSLVLAHADNTVTLRFSWWGGEERHASTLNAIELFEQAYPNIKIEAEYGGWDGYKDKLLTQLTGGTAPDIMQIDQPWLQEMASQGISFLDLNTVGDTVSFDAVAPEFTNQFCVVDGKLLGLPTGLNGYAFYQNTALLEKYGIEIPKQWTYENLITAGEALHQADPDKYLLAHDVGILNVWFSIYIVQRAGGDYITGDYTLDFTVEDVQAYFEWVAKMFEVGALEPEDQAALYSGKIEQNPKWLGGNFAINSNWTSTYSQTTRSSGFTDAVEYPKLENGDNDTITIRPSQIISINADNKNQEAALAFVDFFYNNEEAIRALGTSRSIPASEKAREILAADGLIDPTVAASMDMASPRAAKPVSAVANNSEISQIITDACEMLAYGKVTPAQAAQDCYDQLLEKLEELKNLQ